MNKVSGKSMKKRVYSVVMELGLSAIAIGVWVRKREKYSPWGGTVYWVGPLEVGD